MPFSSIPLRPSGPPDLRDFGDTTGLRGAVFDQVRAAISAIPPVTNPKYHLELADVDYEGPEEYSKRDEKQAILSGGSLGRRIRGTWRLKDATTGDLIDERRLTLGTVPYLTQRNTYILNGTEYGLANQLRLRPGIFGREKANGELESHVNVAHGFGHRYFYEPKTGVFRLQLAQAKMPLLPILHALGATDKQIREAWGDDLHAANMKVNEPVILKKLYQKIKGDKQPDNPDDIVQAIRDAFATMTLDPEVTKRTLGAPHDRVTPEAALAATQKLLRIRAGEADTDDRDALPYQRIMGHEDLFSDRVKRGMGEVRKMLWKATFPGNLQKAMPGTLDKALRGTILETGLGSPLEEVNDAELLDQTYRVTRMGEGGIPSTEAVPDDARAVQPSQFGLIDLVHTPESGNIGVDGRVTLQTKKDKDGKLYARYRDRQGNEVWKTPQELADAIVAFPGELAKKTPYVSAMVNGRHDYVPRNKVDYELWHMQDAFGPLLNMIPLKNAAFPQRCGMGARYITQALPMPNNEAPLVQPLVAGTNQTYHELYGEKMGAIRSQVPGVVMDVTPDEITIRGADRKLHKVELYNNLPYARKTFRHNTPMVQVGNRVEPGQLLAKSNFTDNNGTVALGLNARVAYIPYKGYNFEDAQVISESFAARTGSEHMYQHTLDLDDTTKASKNAFISMFPGVYDRQLLGKYDENGVIKPGETVNLDEPVILAVKQRVTGPKLGRRKHSWADASVKWEHHAPGVVTDVYQGKNGINVVVKSIQPTQVGDKFSGLYGDKGVVAKILPDAEMPTGPDGKPYEMLVNPLGVISRGNPSQLIEAALGKIASRTGKPYRVEDFKDDRDLEEWANGELKRNGVSLKETLTDPATGRATPGIATGVRYILKLHHTAEAKAQARSTAQYTSEDAPAKGGAEGAKRVGMLELAALLSHGAYPTIHDASLVRGQANPDYWRMTMQGYTPPDPKVPHVQQKFMAYLQGMGINPIKQGTKTNIMALNQRDLDKLVGDREISNAETVDWRKDQLSPIPGGLFDPTTTGGHGGNRWSYIKLHEPMPSPVMEEPIRRILGLTEQKYLDVLAGKEPFALNQKPGDPVKTGPLAIKDALESIDVDKAIDHAKAEIAGTRKTTRDEAIRKLGFLMRAKEIGQHPSEWMWDKMPVLPPTYRPVAVMGATGTPLVADPNYLYKEVFEANDALKSLDGKVDDLSNERLAVYGAMKGATGLGDPIQPQHQEQQIKGILKHVTGPNPKFGMIHRKILGSAVDLVGRATITPNPELDMDQVGLPMEQAWTMYRPFIARRLVRRGMGGLQALKEIENQSPAALRELQEEVKARPLVISRAPVLHKYGVQAFWPVLTNTKTLQISPVVCKGFNADFDGDAMQFHVVGSQAALDDAKNRLLPSKNLIQPTDKRTPAYAPVNEYQGGLWTATSVKDTKKQPRTFATRKDVIEAYQRGEITADTPVIVHESS